MQTPLQGVKGYFLDVEDGTETDGKLGGGGKSVPIRSAVFSRVLGDPCGGFSSTAIIPVEPVVAARCLSRTVQDAM